MGFLDFLTAAGPAISGVGSMIGGIFQADAQRDANATSAAMAQKQMDFQERMSSSAYQRAMADMSKAGLNPMLAYSQGGASSPAGAMPTITPVDGMAKGFSDALKSSVATAYQKKELDKVLEQKDADIGLAKEATNAKATESKVNLANASQIEMQMKQIAEQVKNLKIDRDVKTQQARALQIENTINTLGMAAKSQKLMNELEWAKRDSKYVETDNAIKRAGNVLGIYKPWNINLGQ